jgi:hypothetical protein
MEDVEGQQETDADREDQTEIGAHMERKTLTYRDGLERAAEEVQIVCDRLDKPKLGEIIASWVRGLPDDPTALHIGTPAQKRD